MGTKRLPKKGGYMKTGEHDLDQLIANMQPILSTEIYRFAILPIGEDISHLRPLMQFHEEEGLTAIIRQDLVDKYKIPAIYPCRQITLAIHSALDAVGFLDVITRTLAGRGISCNVVSGFTHDHLFVPVDQAGTAYEALLQLSETKTLRN